MSDRPVGQPPSRIVAVLGPTNTGKTHLAIERMVGYASGMIGLPLRLLAREVYDRIVKLRGKASVALITGEEKIVPPRAVYFVCTVEAMPLTREVEFLAIDEIQLAADPTRGHVFTDRLLHARGRYETMFLGSASMTGLIRRLVPDVEFTTRERFSTLTYAGSKKLTRLPRRTAVVAFSAERVYAIAELIRRQRGGAAVVMGSLSPRTRNAQVALYQSGEVDFLVATDAIGMGLNMDVDHVAFAGLRKFDGKRTRWLTRAEVAQVAGRAGRYRRDGTFVVTGEADDMDAGLVEAVEEHLVEPIDQINWRSARLDFQTLPGLVRSLAAPPISLGLKLADQALDETTLRLLAADPEVATRARGGGNLHTLWDICQTPDFRKTTMDEHLRLVREVFFHLTEKRRRLPEDWIAGQFAPLDRTEGEIDVLAQRLAGVANAGLRRQPFRLAGGCAGLAREDPRAGRPSLRHPAPEADATVHRPAHIGPDALALHQRGNPGGRVGRRRGDGGGAGGGAPDGSSVRPRARLHGAGNQSTARRRRARCGTGDCPASWSVSRRYGRGLRLRRGWTPPLGRRGGGADRRRLTLPSPRGAVRRAWPSGGARTGANAT